MKTCSFQNTFLSLPAVEKHYRAIHPAITRCSKRTMPFQLWTRRTSAGALWACCSPGDDLPSCDIPSATLPQISSWSAQSQLERGLTVWAALNFYLNSLPPACISKNKENNFRYYRSEWLFSSSKQGDENKWTSVNLETQSWFVWCLGVRLEKWNDPFWQQRKQDISLHWHRISQY